METLLANWKTTLAGLVGAFFSFVLFDTSVHFPQWVESLAAFAAAGGIAGLGIAAMDGGKKDTPPE